MGTAKDPRVQEVLRLARAGDKARARELLIEILNQDRDNFDAWIIMSQVSENNQEAITCVKQALRLRPGDERARRYLEHLLQGEESEDKRERVSPWLWGGLGAALIFLLLVAGILVFSRMGSQGQTAAGQPTILPVDCAALINKALEMSDQGCQQIGHNEFCYGHNTIQAQLVPGADILFDRPGSTIPINFLESFITAPLDAQKNEWGVGVFRLEANLPGTLPGQLVTILVFGNTTLENASGNMQAVYFTSGLGGIQCGDAPFNGLMVRMPEGAGYVFKVNGTDVSLQGTSVLDAYTDGNLDVTMLDGTGKVGAFGQEQVIGPGQKVSVPLDGKDAGGPPGTPESIDPGIICALIGLNCPGDGGVAQVSTNTSVPIDPNKPTNTPVPIDPNKPTNTPVPVLPGMPTNTPVPLATNTSAPLPTNTSGPGATKTNTPASGVPTNTPKPGVTPPTATSTKTLTPTNTLTPTLTTPPPTATDTPSPTVTETPSPTATTEVPPTSCDAIVLSWGATAPNVSIANNNAAAVTLVNVSISWNGDGKLTRMDLGGDIWNGGGQGVASPVSASITKNNSIANGATMLLAFTFKSGTTATSPFSITLTFSEGGGCTKPISN